MLVSCVVVSYGAVAEMLPPAVIEPPKPPWP